MGLEKGSEIDEIKNIDIGKSIHCVKHNTPEEDYFRGHFPNNPIMPGVIILEALAQASGILGFKTLEKTPENGSLYVFAGIDKARFKKQVVPGDIIIINAKLNQSKSDIHKFSAECRVNDEVVCMAELIGAVRSKNDR